MAQGFRLVVGTAGTASTGFVSSAPPLVLNADTVQRQVSLIPKQFTFTLDSGNVIAIETELKKEKHRLSQLVATIYDPQWTIFNSLQDPAFVDLPVQLYLARADTPANADTLVFDGKVTSLQVGYPAYDKLTIVAHDRSVDLRRQQKYRTVRGQTSIQVAQNIAYEYGYLVDLTQLNTAVAASVATVRAGEFGPEVSDWDLLTRMLNFDGLEIYTKGKKLFIRQAASQIYQTKFVRDEYPVIHLDAQINHVSSASAPDKKGSVTLENSGTFSSSSQANTANEANKQGASTRTHRRPIGSPDSTANSSHAEQQSNKAWTNQVSNIRKRKDTATLVCALIPDLGLQHVVPLSGWGAKVDGAWHVISISHRVSGSDYATTTVSMQRAPTQSAKSAASVPVALESNTTTGATDAAKADDSLNNAASLIKVSKVLR